MVTELWLTILLTLNQPDHPKALSPTSARSQIEPLAIAHYGPTEWACLNRLIYRESRWNPRANNPDSTAFGLFQLLRMPEHLTPLEQWERGVRYIAHRYAGSPCQALASSLTRGWY